jgi:hypothetical protein
MSADPNLMRYMLMQQLMQPKQTAAYGGGMAGPQMQAQQSPLGGASNVVQKLMLMRALQGQSPQGQIPAPATGPVPLPMQTPAPATGPVPLPTQ